MAALREDLYGWGFDFLAVDQNDQLALFCSSGYGEIPPSALNFFFKGSAPLLEELPDYERELIDQLPSFGAATIEGRGVGQCTAWLELGRRGLFVYDWLDYHGPYDRLVSPSIPITSRQLPSGLRDVIALTLPSSFAATPALANILNAPRLMPASTKPANTLLSSLSRFLLRF